MDRLRIEPADMMAWAEQRQFADLLVIGRDARGRIELGSTSGTVLAIEEMLMAARAYLEECVSRVATPIADSQPER